MGFGFAFSGVRPGGSEFRSQAADDARLTPGSLAGANGFVVHFFIFAAHSSLPVMLLPMPVLRAGDFVIEHEDCCGRSAGSGTENTGNRSQGAERTHRGFSTAKYAKYAKDKWSEALFSRV